MEKEDDDGVKQGEESRRWSLGLLEVISTRSEDSSEEELRKSRRRSGVCCGVGGEAAGVEVMERTEEASQGGEEAFVFSSGRREEDEEVSRPPQSPDRDFLEEMELLLVAESERRLWAESRVLSAASIFLSNIFLVS